MMNRILGVKSLMNMAMRSYIRTIFLGTKFNLPVRLCVIDDYGREVFSVSVTERDRRFGETYEVQGEKYRLFYTEDYKDYSDMQYGIADETGRPIMPIDNIKYLSVGENHWFAVNKIEEDGEGRKCYYMDKNKNVVLDLSDEYDAVYPFVYVK